MSTSPNSSDQMLLEDQDAVKAVDRMTPFDLLTELRTLLDETGRENLYGTEETECGILV